MLFMIFGTLLPMMQQLQQSVHLKKEQLIAYETLHEAAKQVLDSDTSSGVRKVNGRSYRWQMGEQLCVDYEDFLAQLHRVCLE